MHLIRDVFSKEEREKCIEDLQPLLVNIPTMRGRQTHPTLHLLPQFSPLISRILKLSIEYTRLELIVHSAWAKLSNGKKECVGWHDHLASGVDYSSVYYIKVPFLMRNGTLFRDGLCKAPQNSLLIFPAHLEHTTPRHFFGGERYTFTVDFKYDHDG